MTPHDHVEECRTAAALYSVGALPPEESAQFEQRLKSGCPFCTREYAEYATVTAELAASNTVQAPSPSMRERLKARIRAGSAPAAAKEMTLVRSDETPWISLAYPGIEVRQLFGEKTVLVRMQPGAVYPPHEHRAAEQCYVLEGSVTDDSGVTVLAGDFVRMAAGSTHQEIRSETGCVFLIAYTS